MILEKLIDFSVDLFFRFIIHFVKTFTPIKISPKKLIAERKTNGWNEIVTIRLENRLNKDLYGVLLSGVSKEEFDVEVITDDDVINRKTVEYMEINTDRLVVFATDTRNGNSVWIFRIHKFDAKKVINLKIKTNNKKDVHFSIINYDTVEIPIRERHDGTVSIPFLIKDVPEI